MIILFQLIPTLFCFNYEGIINRDLNHIMNEIINGSLPEGRLSIKDVENLFTELKSISNFVHSQIIGESYLNKTIYSYALCSNFTNQKPTILITSLHHSREVASLQMNIYLFLYLLWEVEHEQNPFYINMINHNCILIVPFVNIDGYQEIESEFNKHNLQPITRKNLNRTIACYQTDELAGIDLNRNYAYHFAHDNIGSSNDPCDETYRGSAAFSEKETQAIKYVVQNFNIKMAMNLHCFGNLWVLPYSYDNEELDKDGVPYLIYEDFKLNGHFVGHYQIGHAIELVKYTANGEAADWMLSQGVIAISPELGEQYYSNFFNNFYPDQEQTIKLLKNQFPPLIHFINYLPFQPLIKQLYQYDLNEAQKLLNNQTSNKIYVVDIQCINHGVTNGNYQNFVVSNSVQLIEAFYIDLKYDQIIEREKIHNQQFIKIKIQNNTFSTDQFPPRSQIIYILIFQEVQIGSEVKFYFDLNGEKHSNTFTLTNFNYELKQLKITSLYNLFYVSLLIILIVILGIIIVKKKSKTIKQYHITELVEQRPENIDLNLQN
ncbi:unnamed protein product [Paramecium sonneborni]|uniref:Peptidase M14 domain-containing protein n=1 Tax=Paramecium sonneborni TaxID=65129 RepID=A0A8S1M355_9CILI|nr:unnamed protein product [Paramecium sonneborni]